MILFNLAYLNIKTGSIFTIAKKTTYSGYEKPNYL